MFRTAKFKLKIEFFSAWSVVDLCKICKFFFTSSSVLTVLTILQNFIAIRQKEPCLRLKYVIFQKMLSDPCLNITEKLLFQSSALGVQRLMMFSLGRYCILTTRNHPHHTVWYFALQLLLSKTLLFIPFLSFIKDLFQICPSIFPVCALLFSYCYTSFIK